MPICSRIQEDVAIQPMPKKPAFLLARSDDSVDVDVKTPKEGGQPAKSSEDIETSGGDEAAPMENPPLQQPVAGMGQIVFKFPDGREEVMDVTNMEILRRVAKAHQVLSPLQSRMSGSFPPTRQQNPLSTSSLPAALAPGSNVEEGHW